MTRASSRTRITNAKLVCSSGTVLDGGCLDIENDSIAWVGSMDESPAWSGAVLNADGAVLAPGFTDLHVRSGEPGAEYRETLEETVAAALRGGFTRLCLTSNSSVNHDSRPIVEYLMRRSSEIGGSRLLPLGALTVGRSGQRLAELFDLRDGGAVGFTDYDSTVACAGLMRRALEYAKATGRPVFEFPNNPSLSGAGVIHEGEVSTRLGLKPVPSAAEEVRVYRAIALARLTQAPIHIGPISSRSSVAAIRVAKEEGLPITASVLATHLKFCDHHILASWSTNLKVRPVLRTEDDRQGLIEGVLDGTIDAVSSGHEAMGLLDKQVPFPEAEFGLLGLQTTLSVLLELRREQTDLELPLLVKRLTEGPARCLRQAPSRLLAGSRADLVLFRPDEESIVDAASLGGRAQNTPLLGFKLPGVITNTWVGGVLYETPRKIRE